MKRLTVWVAVASVIILGVAGPAGARDAAFLDPGNGTIVAGTEAVKVEPKPEIDVGETVLNVAKRTSVFFVNQTNAVVKIEKVAVNSDSNVTAEATANDCTKLGEIAAASRCSVEISVTATSPGSWSVDVLMTHNGAGRIARARLTGKTSGSIASDNKGTGLAVAGKDIKPIDFGDVAVGAGKTVRSTLMVNDSPEPITLYSIDVIEADNGLKRLDEGCAVDMELEPGASCPVTLLWVPKYNGPVSTDLIIRHSGRLGFAVVPVRGAAKGGSDAPLAETKPAGVPAPPSAPELEKALVAAAPQVASSTLTAAAAPAVSSQPSAEGVVDESTIQLIGTIGSRALLLNSDGDTKVVETGGEFEDSGHHWKLISVGGRSADISFKDKKKTLQLVSASILIDRATKQSEEDAAIDNAQAHAVPAFAAGGAKK